MVKDNSESKRGNPLPGLHWLIFLISSKGSFICNIPDRIVHITVYVTQVVPEETRNSSVGPLRIDPTTRRTVSERSITKLDLAPSWIMSLTLIQLYSYVLKHITYCWGVF